MNEKQRRTGVLLLAASIIVPEAAPSQTAQTHALNLREAVERTLARSPEVLAARAQAAEAQASARMAAAGFAPQAFATTTPGISSGLPVAVAGRVPSVFGFEIHKTIYDPVRRAEVLQSEASEAGQTGTVALATSAAVRALVIAYGRNWADQTLLGDSRRSLEARERIFRQVSELAREGRRTDLDVDQAALEVARAKQTLADREAEFELDRVELAHAVDGSSRESFSVAEDPLAALPEPSGDSLSAARAADPELAALARQTDALERAASLQKRSWLPVVQAEGQYLRLANYNNFDQYFVRFKPNDWAAGVSVVVPLWTGGRRDSGQAAANARLEKTRADRKTRERDLELAVRRAEIDTARAQGQFQLAQRGLSTAREALRVAQALGNEGRGEPAEIDRREIALAQAQDDQIQAAQGLLAARARLLELTGKLPGTLVPNATSSGTAEVASAD